MDLKDLQALLTFVAENAEEISGRYGLVSKESVGAIQRRLLVLENEGSFFEGRPEDYIAGARTPRRYRNPFLAQAMAELNMIDTMGYGIHEMHVGQARRYSPMPDYDLSEPQAVKKAVFRLSQRPAIISRSPGSAAYHFSVKPAHRFGIGESLKE